MPTSLQNWKNRFIWDFRDFFLKNQFFTCLTAFYSKALFTKHLDNKIIFQISLRTQKSVKFCGSCGSIKSIFQGILILCCKQTQNSIFYNNSQHNLKLDTPTFHLSPFLFGRIIYSAPFSCMNRQPIFVSGRNLGLLPSVHLNTP